MRKTGRFATAITLALVFLCFLPNGFAEPSEVQVTAEVDRDDITADDTVSLKINVVTEGGGVEVDDPTFSAPDFDVVNSFQTSFLQSYYENGQFGSRSTKGITKVLRPKRQGQLKISNIRVNVNGKPQTAPAVVVNVAAAGAGTPPPSRYGSQGLRNQGQASGKTFYLTAEVNKAKVYKGEQVIVSYYLYRRVPVFNMEFTKFPKLEGFLKEDLENAGTGSQTPESTVVVQGLPFQKKLLVRYAAYPIKEGKLRMDPMAVKAYYQNRGGMAGEGDAGDQGEDDPFFSMMQRFTPSVGARESEPVSIDVLPLPLTGQTSAFSGAVGEFDIGVSLDQNSVPANSPVTLTVTIQGRGNVSLIKDIKAQWPADLDLYDSKGRSRAGQGGVNERIFEYLLIPRKEGQYTIPGFSFEYFDPGKQKYVLKSTSPVILVAGAPRPGSEPAPSPAQSAQSANPDGSPKPTDGSVAIALPEPNKFIRWAAVIAAALGALVGLFFGMQALWRRWKQRPRKIKKKGPQEIAGRLRGIGKGVSSPQDLMKAYDQMTQVMYDGLDAAYGVTSRSFSRRELRDLLGLSAESFGEWERLFETAEMVQFSSQKNGAVSQADMSRLAECVEKASALIRGLSAKRD